MSKHSSNYQDSSPEAVEYDQSHAGYFLQQSWSFNEQPLDHGSMPKTPDGSFQDQGYHNTQHIDNWSHGGLGSPIGGNVVMASHTPFNFHRSQAPSNGSSQAASPSNSENQSFSHSTSALPGISYRMPASGRGHPTHSASTSGSHRPQSSGSGRVVRRQASPLTSPAQVTSSEQTASPDNGQLSMQLRTASRKPKRMPPSYRPPASPEEKRARHCHNVVEKQYRNRLNAQFELLLAVLPKRADSDETNDNCDVDDDRRFSKVEVLDMARRRIRSLERDIDALHFERTDIESLSSPQQGRGQRSGESGFGG